MCVVEEWLSSTKPGLQIDSPLFPTPFLGVLQRIRKSLTSQITLSLCRMSLALFIYPIVAFCAAKPLSKKTLNLCHIKDFPCFACLTVIGRGSYSVRGWRNMVLSGALWFLGS